MEGMIHPCCALLLSSSGGQSCQMVVNLWQQGRLFVWILFRLTSQVCALSLGVDVLLNGGRCIDKVLWPGQKGVNQEVTLTVRGDTRPLPSGGKTHSDELFCGLVQFSSNVLDVVSLFVSGCCVWPLVRSKVKITPCRQIENQTIYLETCHCEVCKLRHKKVPWSFVSFTYTQI